MKTTCCLFFLLPLYCFSQKTINKVYVNPNVIIRKGVSYTPPLLGVNLNGGVRVKNFGIGAGLEYFKIFSDLKSATPIFLDFRYFFNSNKTSDSKYFPFAAFNVGKLIWTASQTIGPQSQNSTTNYRGKSFLGIEAGMVWGKIQKNSFSTSIGYKKFSVARSSIYRSTRRADGSTGPVVEIRSPGVTDKFSEAFLKIGYTF